MYKNSHCLWLCCLWWLNQILAVSACHGSASYWDARYCRVNTTIPVGDACAQLGEFLPCRHLTSSEIFLSRQSDNAWLLLYRQAAGAFFNRLEEQRYETGESVLVDFDIELALIKLAWGCAVLPTGNKSLPFIAPNTPLGGAYVRFAARISDYNTRPSDIDLSWVACHHGRDQADGWDEVVLKELLPGVLEKSSTPLYSTLVVYQILVASLFVMILLLLVSFACFYYYPKCAGVAVEQSVPSFLSLSEDDFEEL